jgi:hypothetical protein
VFVTQDPFTVGQHSLAPIEMLLASPSGGRREHLSVGQVAPATNAATM